MAPLRLMLVSTLAAVLVTAAALLWRNDHRPRQMTATFDPPYPEANADGDPIRAVLEGRIPCEVADCQRLKVQLVLYEQARERSPTTYWLGVIGARGDDRVVAQGRWRIERGVEGYPDALVYVLDRQADERLRYFWRVSDDVLLVLDSRRRPKAGNDAWGNMLSRYDAPYGPRTYTWQR